MSREIPMDKALVDEDRKYLRDRGSWGTAIETRIDAQFPPSAEALAAYDARERADSVTAPGDRALAEENAQLREQLAALQAKSAEPADQAPNYSSWLKVDLEAEVDRINAEDADAKLSKGTKDAMVETLNAYFAE